jgi:hypothetical protein
MTLNVKSTGWVIESKKINVCFRAFYLFAHQKNSHMLEKSTLVSSYLAFILFGNVSKQNYLVISLLTSYFYKKEVKHRPFGNGMSVECHSQCTDNVKVNYQ